MSDYFLIAARREITDAQYKVMCDILMNCPDTHICGMGKVFASIPPKKGWRTLQILTHILNEAHKVIESRAPTHEIHGSHDS